MEKDRTESEAAAREQSTRILELLRAGALPGGMVLRLDSDQILANLPRLLQAGVTPDDIRSRLSPSQIADHLALLNKFGAGIDIHDVLSDLTPEQLALYERKIQQSIYDPEQS